MNTANNARRRESVRRIEETFMELLRERELQEITVSLLCKECGINRSTFYANFEDIYALADTIRANLEQQVIGLYGQEGELVQGYDWLPLFRHMQENLPFYQTYFKLGYDEGHPVRLYDAARARGDFDAEYLEYHLDFFRAGFNAMVKRWMRGGCAESPETMCEIIRREYRRE